MTESVATAPSANENTSPGILNIIAIHGTGFPMPGQQIEGLRDGFHKAGVAKDFVRIDKLFENPEDPKKSFEYKVIEFEAKSSKGEPIKVRMWDANWADLDAAPKNPFALILFFARLLLSTTVYAETTGWTSYVFHVLISSLLLWLPALLALSLWNVLLPPVGFLIAAGIIAIAMFLMARAVERTCALAAWSGWVWVGIVVLIGLLQLFFSDPLLDPRQVAGDKPFMWGAGAVTLAGPILVFVFLLSQICWKVLPAKPGERRRAGQAALSLAGLLAVTFSLLAGASAIFLALNLGLAQSAFFLDKHKLAAWAKGYSEALPYHILTAEIITFCTTLIAIAYLGFAFWSWWRDTIKNRNEERQKRSGDRFRRDMQRAVVLILALFFGSAFLIGADVVDRAFGWPNKVADYLRMSSTWVSGAAGLDIHEMGAGGLLAIYAASAPRMAPLLGFASKHVRTALDHMADVLLYLHDKEGQQDKLRRAVVCCKDAVPEGTPETTVIAAHSQGSRIAVDIATEQELKIARLATVGSPISVLYGTFLDAEGIEGWNSVVAPTMPAGAGSTPPRPEIEWANFWRGSDFIGGRITGEAVADREIVVDLDKHHYDYWGDRSVLEFLLWGKIPPDPGRNI